MVDIWKIFSVFSIVLIIVMLVWNEFIFTKLINKIKENEQLKQTLQDIQSGE